MMRLRRFLVLGIPACGSATPREEPPRPPLSSIEALTPAPDQVGAPRPDAAVATFDPRSCAIDQVPQSICGHYDETCTPESLRESSEIWRNEIADKYRMSGWQFDPATTEVWKERELARWPTIDVSSACCLSLCVAIDVGAAPPLSARPTVPPGWPPNQMRVEEWCLPKPPAGTSAPAVTAPDCPKGVKLQGELRPLKEANLTECCYQGWVKRYNPGGRPARVEGEPRFADVVRGDAWHASSLPALPIDPMRAAKWLAQARMEHASVAAFSTTSLRLLAHGAPPELVAGAHRAALEEIRHAQIAFALASAYAGTPLSPGGFDGASAMHGVTLAELAIETFVDGCVGETLGAMAAAHEAETESDPVLANLLRGIAEDEARHADLAWQIVSWCVRREPAIAKLLAVMLGARLQPSLRAGA